MLKLADRPETDEPSSRPVADGRHSPPYVFSATGTEWIPATYEWKPTARAAATAEAMVSLGLTVGDQFFLARLSFDELEAWRATSYQTQPAVTHVEKVVAKRSRPRLKLV